MSRLASLGGKPVFNAKTALRLTILPRDIAKADPKRPETCAAARACLRQTHALDVRVHVGRIYVRQNESSWLRYLTPATLRTELIAFDRGGTFEPGEYTLKPMQPSKQTGKRQGSNKDAKSRKKRRPYSVVKDVRTGPA